MGRTRIRSATAGETERGLHWACVHKVKRGSTTSSGWLHCLARPSYDRGGLAEMILTMFNAKRPESLPHTVSECDKRVNMGKRLISRRAVLEVFVLIKWI